MSKNFQNSKFLTLFSLIPLILSIGITPGLSFGFVPDSANHQLSNGALPHEVTCSQDKTLVVRSNGKPACVKPGTGKDWEASGMGKTNPVSDCKPGMATLENASTGAIFCADQDKAQKYINQGWESLDEMPPQKTSISECSGGRTQLKNPNTGSIICPNQDKVQKYINEGWIST